MADAEIGNVRYTCVYYVIDAHTRQFIMDIAPT